MCRSKKKSVHVQGIARRGWGRRKSGGFPSTATPQASHLSRTGTNSGVQIGRESAVADQPFSVLFSSSFPRIPRGSGVVLLKAAAPTQPSFHRNMVFARVKSHCRSCSILGRPIACTVQNEMLTIVFYQELQCRCSIHTSRVSSKKHYEMRLKI
jgi:hypothetical protein